MPDRQACIRAQALGLLLVAYKLDRLARSPQDLVTLISYFQQQGMYFISLQEPLETVTAHGLSSSREYLSKAQAAKTFYVTIE